MRLAILFFIIGVSIPVSLLYPFWGLLVFTWLAYMRPQNLAWASSDLRFSYYIAIALFIGCLFGQNKEKTFIKIKENYLLIFFWSWLAFITFFSLWPAQSLPKLLELAKILFIAIITGGLVSNRKRFKYLSWVIALSFAFYAVKGAIVCMLTGYRLEGPEGSMISDNNDFALALNMVLPFFLYLAMNEKTKLKKLFFYLQFPLIIIAVIYTYSRGGFLGLCAVASILILKSQRKLFGILGLIISLILFFNFAPTKYKERIQTIKTYEQDASAMARIYAWQAARNMIKDRPLTGVGLRNFLVVYPQYHYTSPHVAHNSYLQLLAECGLPALGIFLLLLIFSILKLRRLRKRVPFNYATSWLHNYSHMLEVGFIAYMVSGFFLSRADFDLMYQFIGMTVALENIARKEKLIS
jgi:probable O-glycosylation ligase (exosortase A-associated)